MSSPKPRLLDLFSGAGGAARGYQRAGFHVTGVDIVDQPRYAGDEFKLFDALDFLRLKLLQARDGAPFSVDAIHASPPCQAFTTAQKLQGNEHPDLVDPTRELLEATGLPWVIENVRGAPLRDPVCLEGQMFDGLRTIRPRYFETNWPLDVPLMRFSRPRQAKMGRPPAGDEWIQAIGNFSDVQAGRKAMGIDWMTRDELREAIPPAYTELVGLQLLQHLSVTGSAPGNPAIPGPVAGEAGVEGVQAAAASAVSAPVNIAKTLGEK